jgi:hypothetical protein
MNRNLSEVCSFFVMSDNGGDFYWWFGLLVKSIELFLMAVG